MELSIEKGFLVVLYYIFLDIFSFYLRDFYSLGVFLFVCFFGGVVEIAGCFVIFGNFSFFGLLLFLLIEENGERF